MTVTDGSLVSVRAVVHGTNLAKALEAAVLLLTVTGRLHLFSMEANHL